MLLTVRYPHYPGLIPKELGTLSRLRILELAENELSGGVVLLLCHLHFGLVSTCF